MQILLKILLVLDLLVLLVCAYETFFVSSNRSMTTVNLALIACIGLGWWLRFSHPKLALALAGLPAGFVLIAALYLIVMAASGNWR